MIASIIAFTSVMKEKQRKVAAANAALKIQDKELSLYKYLKQNLWELIIYNHHAYICM